MFNRILVAVNESPQAGYARDAGVTLAEQLGAELGLVHVVGTPMACATEWAIPQAEAASEARKDGQAFLEQVGREVPQTLKHQAFLREGNAAEEIVDVAREWEADLIVIGSQGRWRMSQFLLGSVAEEVIRHAPCPVMAIREKVVACEPAVEL